MKGIKARPTGFDASIFQIVTAGDLRSRQVFRTLSSQLFGDPNLLNQILSTLPVYTPLLIDLHVGGNKSLTLRTLAEKPEDVVVFIQNGDQDH